ncbi:unnamed protein product [Caenorhabditis sp. 36 PRJEB53466]|nr:unnamed protein product [Caenorhabditis sp. 36 PRJEB53466]
MAPLFPDFRKIRKRVKRSLNYGSKQPTSLNYPLSQLVVHYFDKKSTFDYLEPDTSALISKCGYADPCTLVVALVYLDRLRVNNKEFFESTDPSSLYIPALVLASKYMHDADTYDRVSNSEWAESLNMSPNDLNTKEWELITKLDWNVSVKNEEFENYLTSMEKWVAKSFIEKNEFTTYNELLQLASIVPIIDIVKQLVEVLSSASLIYCLTLALMSTTLSTVSEPSTSTDVAPKDNNQTFSPVFISSRTVIEPSSDFTFEFDDSRWILEEDVDFEKENATDSATEALCPFKSARQAIDQFRIVFSPYLSCYRQKVSDAGCVGPMSFQYTARLLLLLPFLFPLFTTDQFCATDGNDTPVITDPNYMCNDVNFSSISNPPVQNASHTNYCDVVFLLDLDATLTTEENYTQVIQFMSDATTTCMNRGVGYAVFAWPMFNNTLSCQTEETVCCSAAQCKTAFGFMNYRTYVGQYDTLDPIQPVTSRFNFSYTLIYDMKRIAKPSMACLYNNYVLITNRLFNISEQKDIIDELEKEMGIGCITFTIIAVGNPAIDTEMMYDVYHSVTLNTYAVPSFNCLDILKNCIKPCGTGSSQECYNVTLDVCATPTTTESTSTTTTTSTPKPTMNPEYMNDWQITYLFAITNKTTQDQFNRLVKYISDPLKECDGPVEYDEVLIGSDNQTLLPGNDNVTYELVYTAVSNAPCYNEDGTVHVPRVILLTDYVSDVFVAHIIAFTEEAYDGYKSKLAMKSFQITNDEGYQDTKELKMCQKLGSNVTTIMFIIIGTCSGAMLILILLTVLYRQKYMWMRKLKRFKTSHVPEVDENDVIDHWELSWDKLVVKNEKLGHGAYGHVFKGKIVGVPPAIEKYNRAEALDFADCDCAVKMLPKYATESAKQEFRHEIELMKSLGFNEHLVNMLGCITASAKSCLVLEYCSSRDLLRYVKHKKCDLEISRSVDDTIDSHKEFLNFAWQITQGMRFLVDKKIIHRDLAARNILITEQCGMKSAKVSDFGLAISNEPAENGEVTGSDRLPIKWLALECLEKAEFSHKSDVWSFGIVLFEMYSLGEVPFAEIEPTELIAHLKSGARPKTPLLATEKVEGIMSTCWEEKPMKRPEFDELSSVFATELEQTTEGYGYLELIKTKDYRVVAEAIHQTTDKEKGGTEEAICIDDHPPYVTRNRSVTWRSKANGEAKLGREYSLTTHVCEDETSVPNGTPKLPADGPEKDKKEKKKSYLNMPSILPSLNSINPFSKENEFKKTFKKKFYSRRGSVPY